jgi:hypothetical protein
MAAVKALEAKPRITTDDSTTIFGRIIAEVDSQESCDLDTWSRLIYLDSEGWWEAFIRLSSYSGFL